MGVAVLAAVLAVPAWRLWQSGWYPLADHASLTHRSQDVFTSHTGLTGLPSSFASLLGTVDAPTPHHLGPMPFWVAAPSLVLTDAVAPAVIASMWLLAIASIATIWMVARSSSSRAAPLLALGGSAYLCLVVVDRSSLHPLFVPWTPAMAALPAAAVLAIGWKLIDGGTRWIPGFVLAASFVLQCDLMYLPSVSAMAAFAIAAIARRAVHARRAGAGPEPHRIADRRTWIATGAIAAVCWTLPLLDVILHRGGNARELLAALRTGVPAQGLPAAWAALGEMLAPLRLAPGWHWTSAIGLAAVATTIWAWTSGRLGPSGRSLSLAVLAAVTGGLITAWMLPTATQVTPVFRLPIDIASTFAWTSAAVGAAAALDALAATRPRTVRVVQTLCVVELLILFTVLALINLDRGDITASSPFAGYAPAPRHLAEQLRREDEPGGETIDARAPASLAVLYGLLVATRDGGPYLHVLQGPGENLGEHLVARSADPDLLLTTTSVAPPAVGAKLVARWSASRETDRQLAREEARLADLIREVDDLAISEQQALPAAQALSRDAAYHGRSTVQDADDFVDDVQRLVDHPDRIRSLPDGVLVRMAVAGVFGPLPELDAERDRLEAHGLVASIWRIEP